MGNYCLAQTYDMTIEFRLFFVSFRLLLLAGKCRMSCLVRIKNRKGRLAARGESVRWSHLNSTREMSEKLVK